MLSFALAWMAFQVKAGTDSKPVGKSLGISKGQLAEISEQDLLAEGQVDSDGFVGTEMAGRPRQAQPLPQGLYYSILHYTIY